MQGQTYTWALIATTVTILMGLGGVIRGWQMGFKNRLDLISDWDGKSLPSPAIYAKDFSTVYITLGGVLILMPALLWIGLPILIWAGILGVIIWYWFYAIDAITEKARKAHHG